MPNSPITLLEIQQKAVELKIPVPKAGDQIYYLIRKILLQEKKIETLENKVKEMEKTHVPIPSRTPLSPEKTSKHFGKNGKNRHEIGDGEFFNPEVF